MTAILESSVCSCHQIEYEEHRKFAFCEVGSEVELLKGALPLHHG